MCRLHARPWLGLGDMMRLECTYRNCTVEGVAEALEDMLENGAPEMGNNQSTIIEKKLSTEAAGLLPVGSTITTVHQEVKGMTCCMSNRENVLRFGAGWTDPPE